jgi:hypothetical protein
MKPSICRLASSEMEELMCSPRWRVLLFAGALLLLASCRADPQRPHPVSGKVFFQKQPAHGAIVTFVLLSAADAKAPRPTAMVGKDGSFELTTRRARDGAPAGHYAVTIVYPSSETIVEDQNAGPDLLEGRYADPKTTPLHAEVKPGKNELEPFDLK